MTRKDSEKDADRPHYYSQFWLDVAAGRKTIGGPRTEEEEPLDDEPIAPITSTAPTSPIASRRTSRNGLEHPSVPDGTVERRETYAAQNEVPLARSTVEPTAVNDEIGEPEIEQEPDLSDLATDDIGDLDLQEATVEDADIPDVDLDSLEDEEEEEGFFDEEEEDDDWSGGRGRKKGKPVRQPKSAPKRPPRRDNRRGSF